MKVNQIRAGAVLSYASIVLSTVISFVYTPLMIGRLGDSEYGVYQFVLPIISYLNLLSFGLGSAYVRYYSRFRAANDQRNMKRLNGMFLLAYTVQGTMVLIIGFWLSYHGSVIFGTKLTADEVALGVRLLRIMTVNAALTFPITVFESYVTIHERYLFQKIVAMVKQVLNPLIMIPLLLMGYRSVAMTVLSLVFTILSGLINVFYCVTRLHISFRFGPYTRQDLKLIREMFSFMLYVFIGIVVENVNWSIDRQLLGWIHGSTAVTIYTVASQINVYFLTFATAVSNILTPQVHRLVAENRPKRELDALFTKVGRLQFILLSCILLGFVAVGRNFLVLWGQSAEYADTRYWTALLLMFTCLWSNIESLGYVIAQAKNMHKFRSLLYLAVLIGNILLSIPLCWKWGSLGSALGTAIATLVGDILVMNWYYYRRIGLNIPAFWRHIFHLVPAMIPSAILSVVIATHLHPTSYLSIAAIAAGFAAFYGLNMWLFGMNQYERSLVTAPLRRLNRRR